MVVNEELISVATRIFTNPDLMGMDDCLEVGSAENLALLIAENPLQAIIDLVDIIESN